MTLQLPISGHSLLLCGAFLAAGICSHAFAGEHSVKSGPLLSAEMFPGCYQNSRYSLPAEFPGVMIFTFKGRRDKVKEAWLVLDLPAGVRLIGAAPWWPQRIVNNTRTWDPEPKTRIMTLEREKRKYVRYHVRIAENIVRLLNRDSVTWGRRERVYIQTSSWYRPKQAVPVYWRVATHGFQSPEQTIHLRILPKLMLPGKPVRKFRLMVCKLGHVTAPFPAVRDAYSRYWRALHVRPDTTPLFDLPHISDSIREQIQRDFNMLAMDGAFHGGTPRLDLWKYLTYPRVVKANGVKIRESVCPSYLINDPEGRIWSRLFVTRLQEQRLKGFTAPPQAIIWDFEPGAMDYCFCEVCRRNFADYMNMKRIPAAGEIRSKYRAKWFDFRVRQHTLINRRYSRAIRKNFPKMKYWICTDNLHDSPRMLSEWCGTDERELDPDVDVHLPMIYYSGLQFFKDVALNVKLLKKPVYVLVDPAERMEMFYRRYTPSRIKQNILACAALGAMGIGFWPEDNLDGEYLANIAEGFDLVAKVEKYYAARRDDKCATVMVQKIFERTFDDGGKKVRVAVPDLGDNLQYTAHCRDKSFLVTVFNFDEAQKVLIRIRIPILPGGSYRVRDLATGQIYVDRHGQALTNKVIRSGFLAQVSANGVLVLEIKDTAAGTRILSQDTFLAVLEKQRRTFGNAGVYTGEKNAEASAGWGDVDADGNAEVKLELAKAKVYIAARKNNSVVGWVDKATGNDFLFHGDRGFLGQVLFFHPAAGSSMQQVSLRTLELQDNNPTAVFLTRFSTDVATAGADPEGGSSFDGLEVVTRYTLSNQGRTLHVRYLVTNRNPHKRSINAGFRVKVFPRIGAAITKTASLPLISKIIYRDGIRESSITSAIATNRAIYLLPAIKNHPFAAILNRPAIRSCGIGPVVIEAKTETAVQRMRIIPDKTSTAGFYSWWGTHAFTVEMLTRQVTLAFGRSFTYMVEFQIMP